MADIIRAWIAMTIDFMDVSSYGDAFQSSGEVKIVKDLDTRVEGKDILIVEVSKSLPLKLSSTLWTALHYRKTNSS